VALEFRFNKGFVVCQLTELFSEVAHKMPLQFVEPVEKMINKDIRYRPTARYFSMVSHDTAAFVCNLLLAQNGKVCLRNLEALLIFLGTAKGHITWSIVPSEQYHSTTKVFLWFLPSVSRSKAVGMCNICL